MEKRFKKVVKNPKTGRTRTVRYGQAGKANEQLRADVKRLIVERNRITELVVKWRDMPSEEMRLRAGDMTAQEIRSVKAVLNAILSNVQAHLPKAG